MAAADAANGAGGSRGSCRGWLDKKGWGRQATWKRRWFVLRGFELYYYEEDGGPAGSGRKERGVIIVSGATVDARPKESKPAKAGRGGEGGRPARQVFCIRGRHLKREYLLATETVEERDRWIGSLQAVVSGGSAAAYATAADEVAAGQPMNTSMAWASAVGGDPGRTTHADSQFDPRSSHMGAEGAGGAMLVSASSPQPGTDVDNDADDMTDVEEIEEVEEVEEFEEISESESEPPDEEPAAPQEPEVEDEDQIKFEVLPLECLMDENPGGRQCATCMTVGDKLLVCGTREGEIHVVGVNGCTIMKYTRHEAPVTDVSVDAQENFIAACSADGSVSVVSVYDEKGDESKNFRFDRPVRGVALDPLFASKSTRPFVVGLQSGQLFLVRKPQRQWRDKEMKEIHRGDGTIHAVRWRGGLIAWADNAGVKVVDAASEQRLVTIAREDGAPRGELYRCHLVWENDTTLLVAWANWIVMCTIKERPAYERLDPRVSALFGEVEYKYVTPSYFICGQAPLVRPGAPDKLLLLTYPDDVTQRDRSALSPRAELRILRRGEQMVEEQVYRLQLEGFERLLAGDYRLVFNESARGPQDGDEAMYFIMSPHEVLSCRPCDADDHVAWLVRNKRFEEAVRCVGERQLDCADHTIEKIGEQHLMHLLSLEQYEAAAGFFNEYLACDVARWERWIFEFAERGVLGAIVGVIPTNQRRLPLNRQVYEMMLHYFLERDPAAFLHAVQSWPRPTDPGGTIYRAEPVITAAKKQLKHLTYAAGHGDASWFGPGAARKGAPAKRVGRCARCGARIEESDQSLVSRGLAHLFEAHGRHGDALSIYLTLECGHVFEFIEEKGLHHELHDLVVPLMRESPGRTLQMLLEHHDYIPVDQVVEQLSRAGEREHMEAYLHRLFVGDAGDASTLAGARYHSELVALYAEFRPSSLTRFLREVEKQGFDTLGLDEALQLIRDRRRRADQRIRFSDWRHTMLVTMTPEGCKSGHDFFSGVAVRKDGDRIVVRWRDASRGGPPPSCKIPAETRERREWWDSGNGARPTQRLTHADDKDLWRAEAFLLGRMGQREEALQILVGKIRDVQEAIQFISEEDDEELFELLVARCITGGADFVGDLLEHIVEVEGTNKVIDPIEVIKRISGEHGDMKIKDLKTKLRAIIRDKALGVEQQNYCLRVHRRDEYDLEQSRFRGGLKAIAVRVGESRDDGEQCQLCSQAVQGVPVRWLGKGADRRAVFVKGTNLVPRAVITFCCHHSYHRDCYLRAWTHPVTRKPMVDLDEVNSPVGATRVRRFGDKVQVRESRERDPFIGRPAPHCLLCTNKEQERERRERRALKQEMKARPRGSSAWQGAGGGGLDQSARYDSARAMPGYPGTPTRGRVGQHAQSSHSLR